MKGQVKRFLNHKGKAYDLDVKSKPANDDIGFFDLWRYATRGERAATCAGAAVAWLCSLGLVGAVLVYGELTSLFVQRHAAAPTTPHAHILRLFGGGQLLGAGNRSAHMDALVADSAAFGAASLAVMLAQLACAALAVSLANWAAHRMVARLRLQLLESVISQEIAFFDTNTSMNFASALTEDMEKLREGVGEHVVMTSYLAGTVACGCAVALTFGWQLTLAAMALVPLAVLVQAVVSKYQTKCSEEETVAYGKAGKIVEEVLAAIRTVRAYAGEELEVERYSAALRGAGGAARRRGAWAGAGLGLGWLLTYSLNAVVFVYGAQLVVRDRALPPELQQYHPGVMITVLFCTFMAAQNIAMCNPHLEKFSTARGAAKSLFKLLERKSNINALEERGLKPDRFRGDIEFDDLYFSYPSRPDVKVLRGLSLKIAAGETVALVGGSGCGKSTLLQLLQRMYEPAAGTVTVDGLPLPELDLHHFRRSIGVVGQEPVLFSGTIRENITLGAGDVSEERLVAAATTAHAHHFISRLANGYDTVLGEGGAALSGGQKQRVAIARAVLRSPGLLLLDEPTAALDPAAERAVQAALDAAGRGRTTLVVSHRLSTIVNADRIVYLEQGQVREQGSHAELLRRRGLYWGLLQQDMTLRSIANTRSEGAQRDDDRPLSPEGAELPFRRSYSRHSANDRGSSRSAWRRSARAGSFVGALVPPPAPPPAPAAAAPDLLTHVLEPPRQEPPPAPAAALARLHRPEWGMLAVAGLASFTIGATMPVFAFLFSKLFGMFALADPAAVLAAAWLYAGAFLAVAVLSGLVSFMQTWLFNRTGARLTDRLRQMTFRNFLYQEQAWFDEPANSVGALCARLAADCAAVQGATGTPLGTVLQGVSTMVLGVGLAMAYSWKMTLVSLLSVPCVIGGIYLEEWVKRRSENRSRRALELASRVATEAVLSVRTVQSLGVERALLARYAAALGAADARGGRTRLARGAAYGVCLCAPTLGYAVSLAYGGYLVAREDLPYESAILVSEALIYGAWMLAEALSFAPGFAAARRSAARILAALARRPAVVTEPGAHEIPDWSCAGEVRFSDVQFRYPSRPAVPVLSGATLRLAAGRSLALVGPSGCGKSTLVQLLLRNYDAQAGTVELDGRDARRALSLRQLRAQLGLVPQEPVLFARSLRDNIAYGDTSRAVPAADVERAARLANVHGFISSLPQGYETLVGGGGGAALSGGQRQRVAIARALLRAPRVLLLDEATSALDAASEQAVQTALHAASQGRSTITIAHRLATVRHADTICVIDKGVVAESGSHEELVARRGLYWDLLQQQGAQHS